MSCCALSARLHLAKLRYRKVLQHVENSQTIWEAQTRPDTRPGGAQMSETVGPRSIPAGRPSNDPDTRLGQMYESEGCLEVFPDIPSTLDQT